VYETPTGKDHHLYWYAFDYLYIPPTSQFSFTSWNGLFQILPLFISGVIVAIITGQRESARLHALEAEQEAQLRAEELEHVNAELTEANQLKDQFLSMASHELKTPCYYYSRTGSDRVATSFKEANPATRTCKSAHYSREN
jgi:signal transduction histidine kinase